MKSLRWKSSESWGGFSVVYYNRSARDSSSPSAEPDPEELARRLLLFTYVENPVPIFFGEVAFESGHEERCTSNQLTLVLLFAVDHLHMSREKGSARLDPEAFDVDKACKLLS
jgi:hypothetical protein